MADRPKRIAVLGSTGSIGTRALDVIASSQGRLSATILSAHSRLDELVRQAQRLRPQMVVAADEASARQFDWKRLPPDCELRIGPEALIEAASHPDVDVVLAGIVGSAGLASTWAALEHKKTVALANKETLVMAGQQVAALARRGGALLPVDSEHSALFQAAQAGRHGEIARLILTASGGPFRHLVPAELQRVTVAEALAHPTWNMGPKITVDSATMMNKALEIVEARWLFDIPADQVSVVIHPQSIVHSMVEFVDGSVIAQMSPPDMRLPIQYALYYPERVAGVADRMDWSSALRLEFEPPNRERFPALSLGEQCAAAGGTSGAVLNAANEAAVGLFLSGELHFTEIVPACRSVLAAHHYEPNPTLERLIELDGWAREEISRWMCA
jgi:1-deoxy-D-xylulose-5-phosphate reductoisomerase